MTKGIAIAIALICTLGCGSGEEAGVTKGETSAKEAQTQLDNSMTKEQQEQFKQNASGFNPKNAPK
ncbi:MAG: hypothetical protein WCK51_06980 [Armatimonadota bacterium]